MLWNMLCAERSWWDFASYDPRSVGLELFVVRMERDDVRLAAIEAEVVRFNAEVEEVVSRLRSRAKIVLPEPVDTRSAYEQVYDLIGEEVIP